MQGSGFGTCHEQRLWSTNWTTAPSTNEAALVGVHLAQNNLTLGEQLSSVSGSETPFPRWCDASAWDKTKTHHSSIQKVCQHMGGGAEMHLFIFAYINVVKLRSIGFPWPVPFMVFPVFHPSWILGILLNRRFSRIVEAIHFAAFFVLFCKITAPILALGRQNRSS